MKIYKYGKMTYSIRECPNCGCVFSFNKAFVHYGETNAEGKRYYFVQCPNCFNKLMPLWSISLVGKIEDL